MGQCIAGCHEGLATNRRVYEGCSPKSFRVMGAEMAQIRTGTIVPLYEFTYHGPLVDFVIDTGRGMRNGDDASPGSLSLL